jgi:hypothetical protein
MSAPGAAQGPPFIPIPGSKPAACPDAERCLFPAHQRRVDVDPDLPPHPWRTRHPGHRGRARTIPADSETDGRATPSACRRARAARPGRPADALEFPRRPGSPSRRAPTFRSGTRANPVCRPLRGHAPGPARGIPCIATYHTHFEEYLFHYIRFLPKRLAGYAARPGTPASAMRSMPWSCPRNRWPPPCVTTASSTPLRVIPTGLPESQFLPRRRHQRFRRPGTSAGAQGGAVRRPRGV